MDRRSKNIYRKFKKKKVRKVSFFGRIFRIIVIVAALALVLSYASIYIDPARFSLPLFFGLYFIPILFINLFLLLIGIFKRRGYLFITLIALLPGLLLADLFVKTGSEERALGGNEVKVMTYNVGRFSAGEKGMPKETVALKLKEFIERENPDVVCLQEFVIKDTTLAGSWLKRYPYRYSHFFRGSNKYFGNITYSRFPITSSGAITFPGSTNLCIWSDILLDGKTTRLFNCHLESYSISFTSLIKRLSQKGEFSNELIDVHGKMKHTVIRRAEQVNILADKIEESPNPVLVCGDFNDTPTSYTYHHLRKGLKDSFSEGGKGFSATYSALWPLLRIDYILLADEYEADRTVIQRVPYSDHYPVSTLIYQ